MTWEQAVLWLKQQPDRQDLVKACHFDDPLLESVERYYKSTEWNEIRSFLSISSGNRVLDIGAGRGISSYAFAREGCNVTALEPDASGLVGTQAIRQLVSETGLNIDIIKESCECLSFPEETFDIVFARQVLHHAKNMGQMCKEVHRVLKRGGRFLAVREHVITNDKELPLFLENHPLHKLYGGENAYTLKQYKTAIRNGGFFLKTVTGPFTSKINLYPLSMAILKRKAEVKIKLRIPACMFDIFLHVLNVVRRQPGRLYSFLCYKQ